MTAELQRDQSSDGLDCVVRGSHSCQLRGSHGWWTWKGRHKHSLSYWHLPLSWGEFTALWDTIHSLKTSIYQTGNWRSHQSKVRVEGMFKSQGNKARFFLSVPEKNSPLAASLIHSSEGESICSSSEAKVGARGRRGPWCWARIWMPALLCARLCAESPFAPPAARCRKEQALSFGCPSVLLVALVSFPKLSMSSCLGQKWRREDGCPASKRHWLWISSCALLGICRLCWERWYRKEM